MSFLLGKSQPTTTPPVPPPPPVAPPTFASAANQDTQAAAQAAMLGAVGSGFNNTIGSSPQGAPKPSTTGGAKSLFGS